MFFHVYNNSVPSYEWYESCTKGRKIDPPTSFTEKNKNLRKMVLKSCPASAEEKTNLEFVC